MTRSATVLQALRASLAASSDVHRKLRRVLHASPDLSGQERPTLDILRSQLPDSAVVEEVADTGAIVRIGPPGPAVGVRAELDALAVVEESDVEWRSHNGAMHACGHDVHMAGAFALAHAVCELDLPVAMVLVLQPREETLRSGAIDILGSGILERQDVATMVAGHVQPLAAPGVIDCAPGPVNASADEFVVRMQGEGGHAAYPHLGSDAVLAISQFVGSVQQLVSRETDPMQPAVVSVGELSAGTSPNVRPGLATARGTVRATTADHRARLLNRLDEVARGVALTAGCTATIDVIAGEPVLANDPVLAERSRAILSDLGVASTQAIRSCGADDFAYYGRVYPSVMMFVGTGRSSGRLHSSTFLPDEDAVDHVALALAAGYLASAAAIAEPNRG